MSETIENPSKYLGNELEYLRKVLEGEEWSATVGSWANGLEKTFAKKILLEFTKAEYRLLSIG